VLAAAQCTVIGPVCLCVGGCVCGWVFYPAPLKPRHYGAIEVYYYYYYYHDNSKLRASILTKLGL